MPQEELKRLRNTQEEANAMMYQPMPFPQRLVKTRLGQQFGKFMKIIKKSYINVPFVEVIHEMPSCDKFLKEILFKKRRIMENETIILIEEASAIIQNKLPSKLKDSGSFAIPYETGNKEKKINGTCVT